MQTVYVDGSCLGNPGPGGWAVVFTDSEATLSGNEKHTTNNRMELTAVIKALEMTKRQKRVEIVTDSAYVKNGITDWIGAWKKRGWTTTAKTPVKNQDLWIELDRLSENRDVVWTWVKGHSGNVHNSKADALARKKARMLK